MTLPSDLVEEVFAAAGRELVILRPRDAESLLDEQAFDARDEFIPYWADLWPSARLLARTIGARALRGRRVLELGCGLGLPSLAAALAGGRPLATDWAPEQGPHGWDIEQSVQLARELKPLGVDLIDVSSGGMLPHAKIPLGPGYQVPFAARIRREVGISTGAVGLITEPEQAAAIVANDEADVVLIARESLRDPYFPRRAASVLGAKIEAPAQYQRAW